MQETTRICPNNRQNSQPSKALSNFETTMFDLKNFFLTEEKRITFAVRFAKVILQRLI